MQAARVSVSTLPSIIHPLILPPLNHSLPPSLTQSLYSTHVSSLRKILRWLPVACGRQSKLLTVAGKALYSLLPAPLCKLISSHSPPHSHGASGRSSIGEPHSCPTAFALATSSVENLIPNSPRQLLCSAVLSQLQHYLLRKADHPDQSSYPSFQSLFYFLYSS